jgi:phenylalanyl-tRNA synthetase beta chain
LFPDSVSWATIEDSLRALNLAELRSFAPKEILQQAKSIPAGHYSLLLGTVFQSQDATLRDEDLHELSQKVIDVMQSIGGKLRTS